ncbi:MAG: recombinase family protein, partial [Bacilli bacterium]|uniref:recombinase family protein n=1 Tax=Anaerorhabdus sp. TaxID=1872524 RepID=UPI002FCBE6A7
AFDSDSKDRRFESCWARHANRTNLCQPHRFLGYYKIMKYDKDLEKILYKSLRVGVYCRVSTYQKVQKSSLVYQNKGLIREIKEKTNWKFCGSFIDVATGTNMKKQKELNRLISKCLNNEIDIIVTKSASRFSRNTIEALITINKLIANGIAFFLI